MPVQFVLTLRGHPWDLWGLSKIFDGNNTDCTVVNALEPKGRPTVDFSDRAAIDRFQKLGYDKFATLTSKSLLQDEAQGPPDLLKMKVFAYDIIERVNGIGRLIDPDYWPVSYYGLTYNSRGGQGAASPDGTTSNKQNTFLGWHHSHAPFADYVFELSRTEPAVRFILDAFALKTTWVTLYLIYETIKDNVGDQRALESKKWVPVQALSDFRYAANHSRTLSEGMRHASMVQLPKQPISLIEAHTTIDRLTKGWLRSLTSPTT
jgi:hypothetical protein